MKTEIVEDIIARARKCFDELDKILDEYFTLFPEEEDFCNRVCGFVYDFEDIIGHMNVMKKKMKIVEAFLQEEALYDRIENVLYYTDVSSHPYCFNGIQEFHLSVPAEEILKEYDSISDFCISCIPAPGASGGNENGYAKFIGFDPEEDVYEELSLYVNRLEERGVLYRLVVDQRGEK